MSDRKLRIATFNVENLLTRYDFKGRKARGRGLFGLMKRLGQRRMATGRMDASRFELEEADRLATAYAIRDIDADIMCLQEVESEEVLADFERNYLRPLKCTYENRVVLEGNDVRGIDVGAMARRGIDLKAISHHDIRYKDFGLLDDDLDALGVHANERVFKRDCLQVEVNVGGREVTLFACHFKSMRPSRSMERKFGKNADARKLTAPIRRAEARAVHRLVQERFGRSVKDAPWIICGDFNDHAFVNGNKIEDFSANVLLEKEFSVNAVAQLPIDERWTHYYKPETKFSQLDYLLLSPALAAKNAKGKPDILRAGMPLRVPGLTDANRYEGIGWNRPKASDHCPVSIDINLL